MVALVTMVTIAPCSGLPVDPTMKIRSILRALSCAALLAASLPAQAIWTPFGTGCQGSGGSGQGCLSANWNQPLKTAIGVAGNFAIGVASGTTVRIVCGFELDCFTLNASTTLMNVWIYDADAAGRPGNILRSSSMSVGTTQGVWRANITPLILQPNTSFFLVFANAVGRLRLPIAATGPNQVHFFNGPPTWNGPFTTQPWNYNIICCGGTGAVPILSTAQLPKIGGNFPLDLTKARASTIGVLILASSITQWGPFKLPLDLTNAGAGGCSLLASLDFLLPAPTDGQGNATFTLPIPNDSKLLGVVFHNQCMVSDTVNALGWVFSNGGSAKIGQ
jgi:hypothetical protein